MESAGQAPATSPQAAAPVPRASPAHPQAPAPPPEALESISQASESVSEALERANSCTWESIDEVLAGISEVWEELAGARCCGTTAWSGVTGGLVGRCRPGGRLVKGSKLGGSTFGNASQRGN